MRAAPLASVLATIALGLALAACGGSSGGGGGFVSTTAGVASNTTSTGTTTAPPASSTTPGTTAPTSTQTVLASGTIKALTYNVAGLPQFVSQVNPQRNMPLISPKLNAYELVLVQEDFWYHADLDRDARHPFRSTPLSTHTTLVNDGLNTFCNTPFVDLTRVRWGTFFGIWNNGNDGLSSKGFSAARHELHPGVLLDVYNLHADAGGDQGDIDARVQQFAQLARFVATWSAGNAVIIGGDTNLRDRRPRDLQTLADFMGACGLQDSARTLGKPEIIDRWLYRSSADLIITPLAWRLADEMIDSSGAALSDHDGIHVDFEWKWIR